MSSISQTPKLNTVRSVNVRHSNLLVIAVIAIAATVVIANAIASRALTTVGNSASEAYQIFRQGEVTSPVSIAQAYQIFRLGEWASVPVVSYIPLDLTAYHLSERTFMVPKTGAEIYLASERTSIPVRFNAYQQSEWFGK